MGECKGPTIQPGINTILKTKISIPYASWKMVVGNPMEKQVLKF